MVKTKGSNPPVRKWIYTSVDGTLHYLGEFWRQMFQAARVDPQDPELDITGLTRGGYRPTQQGWGTEAQEYFRRLFKNCTALWDLLPENCPEVDPGYDVTSRKSVWDAKLDFGVVCSYYDLFMRCCILFAQTHEGVLPNGDCFPCPSLCDPDPAMVWDSDGSDETIVQSGTAVIAVIGINAPFTWLVSGTDFTLADETTIGLTNTLIAGSSA
ncbi:hypothetical protein LCGC14_2779640 [marine sediment metagenome]|uniref:Uncharacterized protein n=1 Tax=marine sediment metagenome TaxID=412755 RepID=A0A0F8ZFQ2_9ZZZZ